MAGAAIDKAQGQIYLPGVNWGLFAAVALLVLGFKSSDRKSVV